MKIIIIGFIVTAVIFSLGIYSALSSNNPIPAQENVAGFSTQSAPSQGSSDLSVDCSYSFSKLSGEPNPSSYASNYNDICDDTIKDAIYSCYAGLCEPQICDLGDKSMTVFCEVTE